MPSPEYRGRYNVGGQPSATVGRDKLAAYLAARIERLPTTSARRQTIEALRTDLIETPKALSRQPLRRIPRESLLMIIDERLGRYDDGDSRRDELALIRDDIRAGAVDRYRPEAAQ